MRSHLPEGSLVSQSAATSPSCFRVLFDRRALLLGFTVLCLRSQRGIAEEPAPTGEAVLGRAIGVLTREKSAAEQYAVILATVGKSDPALYVRGIELYADAKAEFDGMVAELKFDLTHGQNPVESSVFINTLQGAAQKRIAFTSFVSREVVDKLSGTKPGLPELITAAPELIKAITDSGLSIWKAFHDASKERREAILSEVNQLRWQSFADLAKT
jgi:hypothetical protein